jgi:hypothetical protein
VTIFGFWAPFPVAIFASLLTRFWTSSTTIHPEIQHSDGLKRALSLALNRAARYLSINIFLR